MVSFYAYVETGSLAQSFDPEQLVKEGSFTFWECSPSFTSRSESKFCTREPVSTAVSRYKRFASYFLNFFFQESCLQDEPYLYIFNGSIHFLMH
jgi:hypothetical protein